MGRRRRVKYQTGARSGRRFDVVGLKRRRSMNWWHLISYFFGGAFLANAIPHVISGMTGRPFQSPFAKPPGEGLSSSTVNVLWGFFNAAAGYFLVAHVGDFDLKSIGDVLALAAGALLISLHAARHFGQFHGGNSPEGS